MKNVIKAIALSMALLMILTFPIGVSAASVGEATIDTTQKGSLTIYKTDLTNAEKDGVWDSSYVSTGVYDQNVYDALIGATRDGDADNTSDLGNGEASYCTLITCYPTGVNTHRLLVQGTRIPYEEAETIEEAVQMNVESESCWEDQYMMGIWLGILGMLVASLGYVLFGIIRNNQRRRKGGRYVRKKEAPCR